MTDDYNVKQSLGRWGVHHPGMKAQPDGSEPDKPDPYTVDPSKADATPMDLNTGLNGLFDNPPRVPGGADSPGKGVTVVSVDAIRHYAASVRSLLTEVRKAIVDLDRLASDGFGPGAFGVAIRYKEKVFGSADPTKSSGTLLASTRQVFVQVETIIEELARRCEEIVQKYRTADELTEMDADEFTRTVSGVRTKITGLNLGGT